MVKIMHALASLHKHISLTHDFDVNRTQKYTIRPNINAEIMATTRAQGRFTSERVQRIYETQCSSIKQQRMMRRSGFEQRKTPHKTGDTLQSKRYRTFSEVLKFVARI